MLNTHIWARLISFATLAMIGIGASAQTSSGSGFFVTATGIAATNYHVVEGAARITVFDSKGHQYQAAVQRVDRANDLALVQVDIPRSPHLPIQQSSTVRRGERVFAFGFPRTAIQGIEPKLTDGLISSLTGLGDEPTRFQISNPIQPGNSGGPLFNEEGRVVGVVVATLDATKILAATGSLPQNVNYAVKSNYLLELLASVGSIQVPAEGARGAKRRLPEVIDNAELALVRIVVSHPARTEASREEQSPSTPIVVKIGHVAPLSGQQFKYGRDNENGARMAIEDLNQRSLTLKGRPLRFELQPEDDASVPAQGISAAERLCANSDVIAVVGHLNSGTSISAAPVYNRCNLAALSPSATNPLLTGRGWNNIFRLIASDLSLPEGMAQYASQVLRASSASVVAENNAYSSGTAEAFARAAEVRGIRIISRATISSPQDALHAGEDTGRSKPDVVYYGGLGPQLASAFLSGLHGNGSTTPVLSADGICMAEVARLTAGASSGKVYCSEGGSSLTRMPRGTDWKRQYDARFPQAFMVYSPYTYDAVMLIAEAVMRAGSIDRSAVRVAVASSHYQGVTGSIAFDPSGNLVNPSMTIYQMLNGNKYPLH